jgi:hypothetical protein
VLGAAPVQQLSCDRGVSLVRLGIDEPCVPMALPGPGGDQTGHRHPPRRGPIPLTFRGLARLAWSVAFALSLVHRGIKRFPYGDKLARDIDPIVVEDRDDPVRCDLECGRDRLRPDRV